MAKMMLLATLTVSVLSLVGCYNEDARAVLQCADEHARCVVVVDDLCTTDDRYCPGDAPFSNRLTALVLCDGAYDKCLEVATGTRTPDRFAASEAQ